jgi:hypothetical protein
VQIFNKTVNSPPVCKQFSEIHEMNLRTLTEKHVITFRKQLIHLLYQPAWAILVKLGEINMTPVIILNKIQSFIQLYYRVKCLLYYLQVYAKCFYLTLYTFSFEINESRLSDTRCCITTITSVVIKEWRDVTRDVLCRTTLT